MRQVKRSWCIKMAKSMAIDGEMHVPLSHEQLAIYLALLPIVNDWWEMRLNETIATMLWRLSSNTQK